MRERISISTSVRSNRNGIQNLVNCLESLLKTADDYKNFELVFKFDDDDKFLPDYHSFLKSLEDKLTIKTIVSSRADGYKSMRFFQIDMLLKSSPNTIAY